MKYQDANIKITPINKAKKNINFEINLQACFIVNLLSINPTEEEFVYRAYDHMNIKEHNARVIYRLVKLL